MRAVIYLRVSTKEQAEKDLSEEGFSIPAQREACARYIADQGWEVVDEYIDRGESARSARRPLLQSMLSRIVKEQDVDAVVVHKVDRLARNMEDHVAIRAALRRHGVMLYSVSENLEDTASGKLVEGIHALMAEFYSSNLATEVRKGMNQKAKMGGWPHRAPIGYMNVRETVGTRQVCQIVPDPERAPLVTTAFELYSTGDWTLDSLRAELVQRGLRSKKGSVISVSTLARTLANKLYKGTIEWHGVDHDGLHEAIVQPETFERVQKLLSSRAMRGTRERKHNHYLKGSLWCGVCGRRLSFQPAKDMYLYYYCLGQKNQNRTGCQERFASVDTIESNIEQIYDKAQLPTTWIQQFTAALDTGVRSQRKQASDERASIELRQRQADAEKQKLMEAYYAGAIDIQLLKTEQARLSGEVQIINDRLEALEADHAEWQETIHAALGFAVKCGRTYKRGSDDDRRVLNRAVIKKLEVGLNGLKPGSLAACWLLVEHTRSVF